MLRGNKNLEKPLRLKEIEPQNQIKVTQSHMSRDVANGNVVNGSIFEVLRGNKIRTKPQPVLGLVALTEIELTQ